MSKGLTFTSRIIFCPSHHMQRDMATLAVLSLKFRDCSWWASVRQWALLRANFSARKGEARQVIHKNFLSQEEQQISIGAVQRQKALQVLFLWMWKIPATWLARHLTVLPDAIAMGSLYWKHKAMHCWRAAAGVRSDKPVHPELSISTISLLEWALHCSLQISPGWN